MCQVSHGQEEMVHWQDPHVIKHNEASLLDILQDKDPLLSLHKGQAAEPGAASAGIGHLPTVVVAVGVVDHRALLGQGQVGGV